MDITKDMLQAATRKAVEAGLLPRRVYVEDIATNAEIMRDILEAALESAAKSDSDLSSPAPQPN
ncbi:MAG TPA: hypothetical protein VGU61_07775 [Noviherbaspirillum sp.]|jgi:hypothetical protein|uniref:hypothetical protein n=1 Tax=Noviherbaspirillum sp. TaxID=1926288 RepID=UPI002DDD2C04|nr:hypothetical protein [Noviherbaspirillum sp.]HEV2610151.1 hypothetical protein [Noviherbaspirillum sp.]